MIDADEDASAAQKMLLMIEVAVEEGNTTTTLICAWNEFKVCADAE